MAISDSMNTAPVTCGPSTPVHQVARLMAEHLVGSVIVVDDDGRPIGIVTDRDLALRVVGARRGADTEVAEVMTTDPVTAVPTLAAGEAASHLAARGCRRLPVIDAETRRLLGVVTLDDLLLSSIGLVDGIARVLAEERAERRRELFGL